MLLWLRLKWLLDALLVMMIWAMWVDLTYRAMFLRGELVRQAQDYDSRRLQGEI